MAKFIATTQPNIMNVKNSAYRTGSLALAVLASMISSSNAQDPGRTPVPANRLFPTGNVIFFHPDGTGVGSWNAARLYFKGPDSTLNYDLLPNMAVYRGHMVNTVIGTSNGGATTHAFGFKVDGYGSFGKDGDGGTTPPTDQFINSLSGFQGSIMRQSGNAGMPVGVVNDGHIGEPGTGCFLSEVGNRGNWQEITRQMIQGRPGFTDTRPWVIMGGGEADTLPSGTTLLHRNHNQERSQALNSSTSLRADSLNLEADWDTQLIGGIASPVSLSSVNGGSDSASINALDNAIVVKTRAQFDALAAALNSNPSYMPKVLGLFAFQDMFNDRNEEDLIARSKVTTDPVNFVGPVDNANLGVRSKASRIVLWGDVSGNPGHNAPTFAQMTDVAIKILDRAAKAQTVVNNRRFFLVAEQEANDNFGNNDNAIGMLHAMADTDKAIGVARTFQAANPRTLILTAADSEAGGMQVAAPYRDNVDGGPVEVAGTVIPGPINTSSITTNPAFLNLGQFYFGFNSNNAQGSTNLPNIADGLEGRGQSGTSGGTLMFLSEADEFAQKMEFGINWAGSGDYTGGIVSRASGLNAGLLNSVFSARFDNIDVYRMMYTTLFGQLLNYPVGVQGAR